MRFFVDENLDGPAFVDPQRAAGLDVTRHRDQFAQGVPDTEWLHPRLAALLVRSHQVVAGFFEGCTSPCVAVLAGRPDSEDPDEPKPGRISVPSALARRV